MAITGFYTAANRGDQGILDGMTNALSSYWEDVEIEVIAHYPKATRELTGFECHEPLLRTEKPALLPLFILQAIYLTIWAFAYSNGISLPLWSNKNTAKAMAEADLVLVSGGGFLNDNYKPAIFGRLYEVFFAHILRKPVGVYAHSIGPLNTRRYRLLARIVLGQTNIITVREKISAELIEKMDIDVPLYIVPDAAFASSFESPKTEDMLKQIDIDHNNTVSISVRKWDFYKTEHGHEKYIDELSKVCDHLIEMRYNVVFCSTCAGYGGYTRDDRVTAQEVKNRMKHGEQVDIIVDDLDPNTLIQFYSKMVLHIGTRMHSNIYALLAGTPIIAIGYEHKTLGMMQRMGLKDLVADINEISAEDILRRVEDILNNYNEYKNKIKENVVSIRKEAFRTPILIDKSLKDLVIAPKSITSP